MPSWGAMLNDARSHLFDAPHLVIFPALAIMAAVLAFNLLGDALRDWMDPAHALLHRRNVFGTLNLSVEGILPPSWWKAISIHSVSETPHALKLQDLP